MARPRLLLLDEPSLGLAPLLAERIFEFVAELHRDGLRIALVEQNAHRALELAGGGYVLEPGRIALSGAAAKRRANPAVQSAYLAGDPSAR
jgi:branched-chain amino acid transport system ATP-binding protein